MLGIRRQQLGMIKTSLTELSKNSNHVEKLHIIQTLEKFAYKDYWFNDLNSLQFFDALWINNA